MWYENFGNLDFKGTHVHRQIIGAEHRKKMDITDEDLTVETSSYVVYLFYIYFQFLFVFSCLISLSLSTAGLYQSCRFEDILRLKIYHLELTTKVFREATERVGRNINC